MTDYTKTTDFTSKDSLPSGDSGKIIRGAEFGTEFDNIQTAVNSKSNTDNPTFTGTITGNGSGLTNVAAASIDLTVSSDTDADYNVPFMNATGDGGSAKVLQVDDNGLMFNPNSNTLSVNRLKGSNDNLLIQDTSGNTILDIDAGALEIPVNTTITGTTAVTGNITVTGTVDGRDVAADGTKLDTVETNADVTDTTNVTAAGALMDSELTSIASVKALNQGVATTNSPTFAGVTANGTVEFDGLSGTGAVTVTDILDQDDMSGNSATALATQQSIKAYVDSQVGTVDTLAEVLANGNATGGTDIAFGDNDKAIFGAGSDLQIYHDGSNSYISDQGTGNLRILGDEVLIANAANNEFKATFNTDGSANLYYDGSAKLSTTATGIDVTGTMTADGLTVNEAGTIQLTKNTTSAGDSLGIIEFHDEDGSASADAGKFQLQAFRGADKDSPEFKLIGSNSSGVLESLLVVNSTGINVTGTATTDGLLSQDTSKAVKFTGFKSNGVGDSGSNAHGEIVLGATSAYQGIITYNGTEGDMYFENTWDDASALTHITFDDKRVLTAQGNGDIFFYEDTGTTAKFHWDASAEALGIGTTSPVETLSVAGDAIFTNDTAVTFGYRGTSGSTDLVFRDRYIGADRMRITSTGIDVTGNIQLSAGADRSIIGPDFRSLNIFANPNSSTEGIKFSTDGGTTTEVFIQDGGNVGIGTDSPSNGKLVVEESGTSVGSTIRLIGTNTAGSASQVSHITSYQPAGGAAEASALDFKVRGTDAYATPSTVMTLLGGGNVGIGTSVPTNPLTVSSSGSASYTSSKGIVADYTGSSVTEVVPIGFSWSSSTATQNPYWGIGLVPKNFSAGNADLGFYTTGTEACRIDSSGNLLVGTTSTTGRTDASSGEGIALSAGSYGGFIGATRSGANPLALNRLSSDGAVATFAKDGTTVGSIGTKSGIQYIAGASKGLRFDSTQLIPTDSTGTNSDASFDLGNSGVRFKDLHLSGLAYTNGIVTTDVDIVIQNSDDGIYFGSGFFRPYSADDDVISLGSSTSRFKDLHLSGAVNLGDTHSVNWGTGNERITGLSSSNSLRFITDNEVAMRIDSSQNLLVGVGATYSTNGGHVLKIASGTVSTFETEATTNTNMLVFRNGNGNVGAITTNGTTTTYGTSSDQRLKDNIVDAPPASDDIDAIRVRSFDWKADGSHQKYGMIAQELQTVAPEAVSAPEDPEDMMGVDYSKLVPMLVKEIQSLRARVAQLETN